MLSVVDEVIDEEKTEEQADEGSGDGADEGDDVEYDAEKKGIQYSHVFTPSKPTSIVDSKGLPSSVMDFDSIMNRLVASQERTDYQIQKTDNQMKQLIGSNANRHKDLESAMRLGFVNVLTEMGWKCSLTDVRHIYSMEGDVAKLVSEWDGIVTATSTDSMKYVFFLEMKQKLTSAKFARIEPRFEKTMEAIFADTAIDIRVPEYEAVMAARNFRHRVSRIVVGSCSMSKELINLAENKKYIIYCSA